MKKSKILIALTLLVSLMLGACSPARSNNSGAETTAGDGEATTTEETTTATNPPELHILFGGEEDYSLVCSNSLTNIWDFPVLLKEKTDITFNMMYELQVPTSGGKEILIGSIPSREESAAVLAETPYDGYTVCFRGEKLVIAASGSTLLRKAFTEMLAALEQDENGAWGLPVDFKIEVRNSSVKDQIPKVNTVGTNAGVFDCGEGSYQLCYTGAGKADYEDYLLQLEENGFTLYTENAIGLNLFSTYVTEHTVVRVFWYHADASLRVLYGPRGYLPPVSRTPDPAVETVTPTVTQIGRTGATQGSAGMSYIIQMTDGSFVVVDGGPYDTQDTLKLKQFLYANKPQSHEKPRVIWMISHLHSDHVDLSLDFLSQYSNDIDLEMFCWSIPNYENVVIENEDTANALQYYKTYEELLREKYPNTLRYSFYSGDRLLLPGCEIEFLCTYNDLWPSVIGSINDTSGMWRMTFDSGYNFLVTGDTYPANCDWVCKVYGNLMKSDIVQTPHHGRVGSTTEFYRKVDADILLWSNAAKFLVKSDAYKDASDFPCNAEILLDKTLQNYHSESTTIIDMNTLKATVYDSFIWANGDSGTTASAGMMFSSADSHVLTKHLDKAPFTIEATIQLSPLVSGRGGVIFGNYEASGGECYVVEIFNNGVPRLYFITSGTGKRTVDVKFDGVDIRSEKPVLVSFVLDVAQSKALCYVDGVLKQSKSITITGEFSYPNKHMVGGDYREGNSQYFKGTLYDLIAYSDARTAEEIKDSTNEMDVSDPNALVAYDFRKSGSARLQDLTQNNNDLT